MNNQSMQTESQGSLDSEAPLDQGNMSTHGGDPGVASSSPNNSSSQLPAKKPTRQWAAWTHQEEESFFTALRQVGKNFEKITCRVQSKNKDQVRHYYYRLVRRMNKLLGPELSLDAKNSKDTNAAMLRWWSLLEKYSCKASKLHLKPRRFKIFIEALEHQLLKDRKKNVRKRPSHGENCLAMAPSGVSSQNRETGLDNRQVKLVLVDSQNIQKLGPGKGSFKRNINIGVNRTNNKGELTIVKATRQRRKPGVSSSAAYRKWEKAAIAGVSLVADAAEHLERTMTDKEVDNDQGHKGLNAVEKPLLTLPSSQNLFAESNMHSSVKLKLQLFPIDDCTRRALEMDKHNPHLELTLSTRKKISSVLEHLNRKWGNSSAALGELMLFPYSAQKENLMNNQRWTLDSMVNAADVHAMVGSPSVFRLRYGWFSITTTGSLKVRAPVLPSRIPVEHNMHVENRKGQMLESVPVPVPMPVPVPAPSTNDQSEKLVNTGKAELTSVEKTHTLAHAFIETPKNMCLSKDPKDKIVESSIFATNLPWNRKETGNVDDLRLSSETALSAGEWADSLTNISVGDLLAEVPQNMDAGCIDPPVAESCRCLQQTPFSCDSFDAAIAAHLSRHQSKMAVPPTLASHSSSIWDAEETCDAFSFQKHPVTCAEVSVSSGVDSLGTCKQVSSGGMIEELTDAGGDVEYSTRVDPVSSGGMIEELTDAGGDVEYSTCADPVSECPTSSQVMDNSVKNFSGLTDIYWPDSLGPLDLDIPSCRYHSEDFILGDSLGGLNRLIASSLDAFQNCSFFGSEKKEQTSAVGARETTSFADFKIGSEV